MRKYPVWFGKGYLEKGNPIAPRQVPTSCPGSTGRARLENPIREKIGNIFSDGTERRVTISTVPTGSLVATSPTLVVLSQEVPLQMTLLWEMVQIQG